MASPAEKNRFVYLPFGAGKHCPDRPGCRRGPPESGRTVRRKVVSIGARHASTLLALPRDGTSMTPHRRGHDSRRTDSPVSRRPRIQTCSIARPGSAIVASSTRAVLCAISATGCTIVVKGGTT